MDRIPSLGIGLAYQPALRPYIEEKRDTFDFVEVVPDLLWTDLGAGRKPRYVDDEEGLAFLRRWAGGRPVIPHGIGLSIGTAHRFNRDHLGQVERWFERFGFPWHSDHLAYNLAEHGIDEMNVGVTMPLPRDEETLESLAPRIAEVQRRLPVPFLLENNVYFFEMPGEEMSDAQFLNALCARTGCGLLLDLHNVYCNSRNHPHQGTDAFRLLDELDLGRVVEIHVAGGMEHEGWWLDAHCGPLPAPVWSLLEYALPRCPNLGGVTFEMLGSWFVEMGSERLERELLEVAGALAPVPLHSLGADGGTDGGKNRVSAAVFQSALARLVVDPDFRDGVCARGAEALPEELSALERERLLAVAVDRGLDITRTLHVGFRLAKLLAWIPLTCAVLGREVRIREVGEFWKRRLPVSFYYLEEAVAFCDYVLERAGEGLDVPHLEEVAAYERASLELRRARQAGEPAVPQAVDFRHDPEALLGRLARGEDLAGVPELPCRLVGRRVEDGVEWCIETGLKDYSRHHS